MPTIVDVARLAGVSTATVSRVLNGRSVRPDSLQAVEHAVDELEYRPNHTAQSLRRRSSRLIGLTLGDISTPFATAVALGVEEIARAHGFTLVLCNTAEDPDRERHFLEVAYDAQFAGVVMIPASRSAPVDFLLSTGRPVVAVDRALDSGGVDTILFDDTVLARRATGALIESGARHIACVNGPDSVHTGRYRGAGWRAELAEHGMLDESLLETTNFRDDEGELAMHRLLERPEPPDAVVVTNNFLGVGVLRALDARGATDVAICVVGEVPFLIGARNPLWTVPLQAREMGERAAKLLIQRIDGKGPASGRTVVLPATQPARHGRSR